MKQPCFTINENRNVTLTAYFADDSCAKDRPAVLVIPGGGYRVLSEVEAEPPALAFRRAGFHAFVLQYTVGERCHWPLPLEDYEEAMELIEQNAGKWHIDTSRIIVAGFSAGGHLAACAATTAQHRPAAAVLAYPVIFSYKLVSAKKGKKSFRKKFSVNAKTGKITVKKRLKKGTYKVKVKVKAAGNANYKASAWKTVTFKVKVK